MDGVPGFDLYAALGVDAGADTARIEAAYRAAARIHHPDRRSDTVAATRRMQQLNVARDWLIDPARRRRYDESRGLGRGPGEPPTAGAAPPVDATPPPTGGMAPDGSMAGPILASLSVMLLLTMIFLGTGSIVTTGLAVAALGGLLLGIALTVRGASD
ncbi:MAG: J domain-containing protein [Candidatus Limnocylindria bacterium]